jgi:hypothetical protein
MTRPILTPAQQRALDWLPKDGKARIVEAIDIALVPDLYEMSHLGFADNESWWYANQFCLTPLGRTTFYGDGK